MIYVTVGTQLPFDRLVRIVDLWAQKNSHVEIIGQIGAGLYKPANFKYYDFMSPQKSEEYINESTLVIAHAGMGTILSRLVAGRPIIVFPRNHLLGEHRNSHQLDTVNSLPSFSCLHIAKSEEQLVALLNSQTDTAEGTSISRFANETLLHAIRDFISAT